MAQDELDKIKAKLEKLIRHQESAESLGNLEEAATFAAKAQELMAKYNIENFKLEDEKASDKIEGVRVKLYEEHGWNKTEGDWMINLYGIVSRANLSDIVISHDWDYQNGKLKKLAALYILGEPHNIEMIRYLCTQLINRLKSMQLVAWKTYYGPEKKGTFKRGYFAGAVQAIRTKLYEQKQKSTEQYTGMAGLIKLTEVAIKEKIEEMFGATKTKKSGGSSSNHGRNKGYADGKNMDIHKGVGNGNPGSSRLLN